MCIADDHAVLRDGLRLLIDAQPDMVVLGEADDGASALALVGRTRPDVLVLDLSMPVRSGIDTVPELRRVAPRTRVVVLTVHEEHAYLRRLLAAGADAYVLKRSAASELIHAIRRVDAGETFIDSVLASRSVMRDATARTGVPVERLTPRETEVVTLIARGFGNSEIAARLDISVKTVETHRTRVMDKMRFQTRADIVRYALAEGLLAVDDGR